MDYLAKATSYAQRVVAGDEVAGQLEKLACKRFLNDLAKQGTPGFPYVIDEALGNRACQFIELMPHIKGEWARPEYVNGSLQYACIKLEPWQVFVEFQLFAWVHQDTRRRRFSRVYEEVARKNAKSTRVAARDLYLLAADREPGAQVYNAATTGEQAREVFDVARNMALRKPDFLARFGVDVGKHDITVPGTASSFKPLNAEGSTLDGLNIHAASIDELHAHKTRALFDVIDSATGARSQPVISMITTAGSNRAGICYEQRDYSVKVLQGVVVDDSWLCVIYTIDEGDDWRDPAVWRKANPNLGISCLVSDMEAACRKAMAQPSAVGNFLTKRLNVWISSDSAWMDMQAWDACGDASLTLERVKHLPCVGALDLASKVDIAAKVLVFYDRDKDHYYLIPELFLPERAVTMGRNSQYDGWHRSGHLVVTDGEVTDFDLIEEAIERDQAALLVQEWAFDPWQATQLASHMQEAGATMVELRQTVQNMSEPMKTLEALVLAKKLTHNANPCLTWMVSNVVCHRDVKDNIYPRKEREENKIDGIVAAIMAINRWLAPREEQGAGFTAL